MQDKLQQFSIFELMLNRLSLLLALSIALLSCEQKPMCDDPIATNYGSETDMCMYTAAVGFYIDESSLEAIKSDIGQDVFHLSIINSAETSVYVEGSMGAIWIQENYSFDSGHYGIPTDCQPPFFENFDKIYVYEAHNYPNELMNPNGLLVDIHVSLTYG